MLQSPGDGRALPSAISTGLGPQLGDLSDVRVHDDARSAEVAHSMGVSGFTYGRNVFLAEHANRDVLAHEAAHAAQHRGPAPSGPIELGGDSHSEDFADRAAASRHVPMALSVPVAAPRVRFKDAGGVDVVGVIAREMGTDPAKAKQMLQQASPEGRGSVEAAIRRNFPDDQAKQIIASTPPGGGAPTPEVKGKDAARSHTADKKALVDDKHHPKHMGEGVDGAGGKRMVDPQPAGGGRDEPRLGPERPAAGSDEFQGMATGDLALIHQELIEHEEWKSATQHVGTAGSAGRAAFIAQQAGKGALTGASSGAVIGVATGLVTKLAERFVPIPGVGAIIAGGMSAYGLITKDWKSSAETIGKFGQGSDTYEVLANTIASISEVIDIVVNVLNVIAGVIGLISAVMWLVTICTLGAASPLAATLSSIALGIVAVTSIMDEVNKLVLQPLVLLFRAMHTFTSQADPREVEQEGTDIASAAEGAASYLGGMAGGKLGEGVGGIGAKGHAPAGGAHGNNSGGSPGDEPVKVPGGAKDDPGANSQTGGDSGVPAKEPLDAKQPAGAGDPTPSKDPADPKQASPGDDPAAATQPGGKQPAGEDDPASGGNKDAKDPKDAKGSRKSKKQQAQEKLKEAQAKKAEAYDKLKEVHDQNQRLKQQIAEDRGPEVDQARDQARKAERQKIESERQAKHDEVDQQLKQKLADIDAKASRDAQDIQSREFERDLAAREAAHEQYLDDMRAAYQTANADRAAAGNKLRDQLEANHKEWEASKDSPELQREAEVIDQAHEAANQIIAQVEDPAIRQELQSHENVDHATKVAENAQKQAQHLKDVTRRLEAANRQAQAAHDAELKMIQDDLDTALNQAAADQQAKIDASQELTRKAIADHEAQVDRDKATARSDADAAKSAADAQARDKQPDIDKAGDAAAAQRNQEFDDKWAEAKARGKAASKAWRTANDEANEARGNAGKRVGEADLGGAEDKLKNKLRDTWYGSDYGVPEGPQPQDQDNNNPQNQPGRGYGGGKGKRFIPFVNTSRSVVNSQRVNPHYTDPPGDPKELEALKAQIVADLAARAKAEKDELAMQLAAAKAKGDAKQIAALEQKAQQGGAASKAHEAAVKRTEAANQAQADRNQQAADTFQNNSQRMAGVASLTVPLTVFAGFTWIGAKIGVPHFQKMNDDASKFLAQLGRITSSLGKGQADNAAAKQPIAADATRIQTAGQKGAQNTQTLGQNTQRIGELKGTNDGKIAQADAATAEARNVKATRNASLKTGQARYGQLAGQLKAWAVTHRAARLEAMRQTEANMNRPKDLGQDLQDPTESGDSPVPTPDDPHYA